MPADDVALCNQMSPHNPHCSYTLMFEQNSDGHVIGAPRGAFWKSGAGGFALIIVPSLDLVIYKISSNNNTPLVLRRFNRATIRRSLTCSPSRVMSAMIGNRFRERRLSKAAVRAVMELGGCWRWFVRR